MRLSEIVSQIPGAHLVRDADIAGIAYDSRKVAPGDVFFAISGTRVDGHQFIGDALEKGASAIVAERAVWVPPEKGFAVVSDGRVALSRASACFFGFPSRELLVVGITGTKGKTTTCHLVKTLLDAAGEKTGLIGTVHNIVGQEQRPVTHTTPESLELQDLLRQMVSAGCTAVTMEVSSHALALRRVEDIEFDAAVLTNIGRDHLDFHGTMENYLEAKGALFEMLSRPKRKTRGNLVPCAALNADDPHYDYFNSKTSVQVISYGLSQDASVRALDLDMDQRGTTFTLSYGGRSSRVRIALPGRFNVYNALAASAVSLGIGIDFEAVCHGLGAARSVRGRVEVVPEARDFSVWVDYAHTPESLRDILMLAREMTGGRVISVFGCGGDRDRGKRPVMGRISAEICDVTIITNDNPRTEDPDAILDQIEEGIKQVAARGSYMRIPDRRNAIREAISMARPGDIVVIAGKGHETYQIFRDRTVHFDDVEEARQAIRELRNGSDEHEATDP